MARMKMLFKIKL